MYTESPLSLNRCTIGYNKADHCAGVIYHVTNVHMKCAPPSLAPAT